jgi:hypothetical protein
MNWLRHASPAVSTRPALPHYHLSSLQQNPTCGNNANQSERGICFATTDCRRYHNLISNQQLTISKNEPNCRGIWKGNRGVCSVHCNRWRLRSSTDTSSVWNSMLGCKTWTFRHIHANITCNLKSWHYLKMRLHCIIVLLVRGNCFIMENNTTHAE